LEVVALAQAAQVVLQAQTPCSLLLHLLVVVAEEKQALVKLD
jgi:hypothetical protein